METLTKVFIGVDISKNWVDVCINPINKEMRVDNTKKGLSKLKNSLASYDVHQVVCEATGGYERLLVKTLSPDYKVWCVEPSITKAFIRSKGMRVKTDKIDAKMLALFAAQEECHYKQLHRSEGEEKLLVLTRVREDFVKTLAAEKTRLKHPLYEIPKKIISRHIDYLSKEIKNIEQEITELINQDAVAKKKIEALKSISGIGQTVAVTLLVNMPQLGTLTGKKIAALAGVAPYTRESGLYKGKSKISGGKAEVTRMLFISALSAIRSNSKIKEFYQRLIAAGKKGKVALVAAMRKMIVIANAIVRDAMIINA